MATYGNLIQFCGAYAPGGVCASIPSKMGICAGVYAPAELDKWSPGGLPQIKPICATICAGHKNDLLQPTASPKGRQGPLFQKEYMRQHMRQ